MTCRFLGEKSTSELGFAPSTLIGPCESYTVCNWNEKVFANVSSQIFVCFQNSSLFSSCTSFLWSILWCVNLLVYLVKGCVPYEALTSPPWGQGDSIRSFAVWPIHYTAPMVLCWNECWLWPVICRWCHWSNDDVVGVLLQHFGCMPMSVCSICVH